MEVLDLKISPGKGSLMKKSGSSESAVWSRRRRCICSTELSEEGFSECLQVVLL